jgi:hypothetical protein
MAKIIISGNIISGGGEEWHQRESNVAGIGGEIMAIIEMAVMAKKINIENQRNGEMAAK